MVPETVLEPKRARLSVDEYDLAMRAVVAEDASFFDFSNELEAWSAVESSSFEFDVEFARWFLDEGRQPGRNALGFELKADE